MRTTSANSVRTTREQRTRTRTNNARTTRELRARTHPRTTQRARLASFRLRPGSSQAALHQHLGQRALYYANSSCQNNRVVVRRGRQILSVFCQTTKPMIAETLCTIFFRTLMTIPLPLIRYPSNIVETIGWRLRSCESFKSDQLKLFGIRECR